MFKNINEMLKYVKFTWDRRAVNVLSSERSRSRITFSLLLKLKLSDLNSVYFPSSSLPHSTHTPNNVHYQLDCDVNVQFHSHFAIE